MTYSLNSSRVFSPYLSSRPALANGVIQPAPYKGPVDCARRVYRTLGIRHGLYRGWLPTCLARMSNYAYFGPCMCASIQNVFLCDGVAVRFGLCGL